MTDRDAIRARTAYAVDQWTGDAAQCAADCAALLAELERAERRAKRWKAAAKSERFRYQIAAILFDQLAQRYDLLTRLARDAAQVIRAATIRRGTRRWLADYERLAIEQEDEHPC